MRAKTLSNRCIIALFVALLCLACNRQEDTKRSCPNVPEGLPISEAELSYLALLRAHHKAADIKEQLNDLEGASQEMAQALRVTRPTGSPSEEAYLDLVSRAAVLLLRLNKPEEALALVQSAANITRDSFYLGALKMTEGEIYEGLAKKREAAQDNPGAEAYNRKALDAYEASQSINGRVLNKLQPPLTPSTLGGQNAN
jgi:tetratricopeptide (TPR) repeat protein